MECHIGTQIFFPKAKLGVVLVILGNDPDEEVNMLKICCKKISKLCKPNLEIILGNDQDKEVNMLRSFRLIFAPINTKF